MSQTILIQSNDDLRKLYSINLNTFVGTDVIVRKNADEAIELLRILPEMALIITEAKIEEENTAIKLFNFIKSSGLTTSLIVLGECPSISTEVMCLKFPVDWESVIKQAAQELGIKIQDIIHKLRPNYIPVGLHYFYEIQNTPCDIFIRIKKGVNDYQYVKRINSQDSFNRDVIKKYEEQGLKEFYISKDYLQYFTTFVTNSLLQKLELKDLSLEERILATANAHEIIRDSVQSMGIDTSMIELTYASINSMINSVKNSPQISDLLKFLLSNKVTYAYQLSHLNALMSHYILSKQSWYRTDHLEVLSFVSFFCDITLKSNLQMQISTLHELSEAKMSEEEKKQVLTHALDAVSLIDQYPVSDYIKTVLVQSHGKLDGIGIKDNPGEDLHPLSKVFVISDSFVKILLNPYKPSSKGEILNILQSRFTHPSYQKIMKTLAQKFTGAQYQESKETQNQES